MKIDVLDHGYVRLVSYTQPAPIPDDVTYPGDPPPHPPSNWTGDLEIVRNARVSHNADWRGDVSGLERNAIVEANKDEKLIRYLWNHRHTTPFEAMVFTFEVQAPIFVFRQWHRHRTWSYNEVSARYTELPDIFYVPEPEQIGYQDKKNKQGREGVHEFADRIADTIRISSEIAHRDYKQLIETGMTRELARLVLPVNTYSRMFATVDLLNLFRFLELRLDAHAQYEIRVYAEALLKLVEPICPVACDAFKQEIYERDPTNPPASINR